MVVEESIHQRSVQIVEVTLHQVKRKLVTKIKPFMTSASSAMSVKNLLGASSLYAETISDCAIIVLNLNLQRYVRKTIYNAAES